MVCYSPWGRKELDVTERLHFSFFLKSQKMEVAERMFKPRPVRFQSKLCPPPRETKEALSRREPIIGAAPREKDTAVGQE